MIPPKIFHPKSSRPFPTEFGIGKFWGFLFKESMLCLVDYIRGSPGAILLTFGESYCGLVKTLHIEILP